MAEMYEKANVTGPTEFGELPLSDKIFWNAWLSEHAKRKKEEQDKIEEETE